MNELVDVVAKEARTQTPRAPDSGRLASMLASLADLSHLWWYFSDPQYQRQLPSFHRSTHEFQWTATAEKALRQNDIQSQICFGGSHTTQSAVACKLRCASYNVLSLLDPTPPPLNSETGRARLLREQIKRKGIHLLGLQECRSQQGTIRSSSHLRQCSGSTEQGTFGVELWIALKTPVDQEQAFHEKDCAVVFADPQSMLVWYAGPFGHLLIVVAHAPHTGHTEQVRVQWWRDFEQKVNQHKKDAQVILLIDANAVWAGPPTQYMGDLFENQPNRSTQLFQKFVEQIAGLRAFHLLKLSVGSMVHMGAPWIGEGASYRLCLVGHAVEPGMGRIMDDPEITVGHAGWDHVATIIEVHWEQIGQMSRKRPKYDVMNPHNKAKLFDVLDHCPSPQWSMNASDHAVQLTQYFQDQLAEAFPAPKRKTPTYTREETRQIYQKTVVHKKSLGHFKILELFQILSRIFDAWAHKPHYEGSIRWRILFNFKYAQTMAELQKSADILKAGLKADKNAFLDNLAKEVNECPPAEIFRRLRPVLQPAKKQAPVFRPLPKLLDAEGQPILSRQDQEARWTEHFASIEAGQVVQVEHFAEKHLQRQLERCKPAEYDIRDIPSLYAVESAIRSANSGKTSGPDGIPIELFKALPGKAARILYPLALKLALRVEEPLTWKGGTPICFVQREGTNGRILQSQRHTVDGRYGQGHKSQLEEMDQWTIPQSRTSYATRRETSSASAVWSTAKHVPF